MEIPTFIAVQCRNKYYFIFAVQSSRNPFRKISNNSLFLLVCIINMHHVIHNKDFSSYLYNRYLVCKHLLSPSRSPTTCGPALVPVALWSPPACCPGALHLVSLPTRTPLAQAPAPPITATWLSLISRTSSVTSPSTTSSAQTPSSHRLPTDTMPSRPSLSLRGALPASRCCA